MPAHAPVVSIISMSKMVRCSRRWASSSPAGAVELVEPLLEVGLYLLDGVLHRRPRRHVVAVGVDDDVRQRGRLLAGQRIELDDRFDLVADISWRQALSS